MSLTRAGLIPLALTLVLALGLGPAGAQQKAPAPATPPAPPAAPPAAAATPATPATPRTLSVLVVDVQSLLQNSKSAKMVHQQLEEKRNEFQKDLSHQEELLKRERDTLQRQQASLSPEALSQKERALQQKLADFDHSMQIKRQVLEHANAEALQKIQGEMMKIITQLAKDRKSNLVLQRSELVMFDQSFDVTDAVLQKLDEQLPTLAVNFVVPAATDTPPTAAAHPAATHPAKKKK